MEGPGTQWRSGHGWTGVPLVMPIDPKEVSARLRSDGSKTALIVEQRRIGGRSFIVFLEHRYFAPGTPRNEDFQLLRIVWMEAVWYVALIPTAVVSIADELAKSLGLRRADGTPLCISSQGTERFPIDAPNAWTMENVPGHFAYRNDPALGRTAEQLENDAIDKVLA